VTRQENRKSSTPKIVNADGWEIEACPTNAAAIQTKGDHVAVAWSTGAQDKPRDLMAFSNDGGLRQMTHDFELDRGRSANLAGL